jgi:nucleoside-diphosphate-sugar epimerase
MKILFIGGTKFIGGMLVKKFLEENADVLIFSRSSPLSRNARYINGDRNIPRDLDNLKKIIDGEVFDYVYDMCCYNPAQAIQIMKKLKTHTKHLIFFSSAAVYAKSETFPIYESSPVGPNASFGDYGTKKAAIEQIYKEVCTENNIKLTIFRPHYILGEGDYFFRHHYFFSRIEKGIPFQVPGNGQALIQFAYAPDVVRLFHKTPKQQKSQIESINVATPEILSLVGIINAFGDAAKIKPIIQHIDYKELGLNEQYYYDDLFPLPNLNLILDSTIAEKKYGFNGSKLSCYIDELFNDWTENKTSYTISDPLF